MLVLSRKLNQSIHLGDNITISIVRIKGNVVQLGIEAPKEIHILRSELLERNAHSTAQSGGMNVAADEAAESSGPFAAEKKSKDGDDDQSELMAALRLMSQSDNAHSIPPAISLFTGS